MNNTYYCKKSFVKKNEVDNVVLILDNGEYLMLDRKTICDFNFVFFDKLVWFDERANPKAKSGFLKLKIEDNPRFCLPTVLESYKEYRQCSKNFILNKLVDDAEIIAIVFIDEDDCEYFVLGNFKVTVKGEYMFISVVDCNSNQSFNDSNFHIRLNPIIKRNISKINIEFDNGESFDIFGTEIEAMDLSFEEELTRYQRGYFRELKQGYIKIKLTEHMDYRNVDLYDGRKVYKKKHLANRLVKKNKCFSTITVLRIYYHYDDYNVREYEDIDVKALHISKNGFFDFGIDSDYIQDIHISGYTKREDKDTIVIVLGKVL